MDGRLTRHRSLASLVGAVLIVTGAVLLIRHSAAPPRAPAAPAGTIPAAAEPAAAATPTAAPPAAAKPRLRLPAELPAGTITLPVLMYHRIDRPARGLPDLTQRLTVAPRDFAAQMAWLSGHGYHAVTQQQVFAAVVRGRPLPARPVLVTFDDGYRDVLVHAVPVLARLHMPATAYVITDRTGNDTRGPWLSWADLRRMERIGIDIGSHTINHRDLTAMPPARALDELVRSRLRLEARLHHPVQWFAYPFGAFNPRVEALTRRAGYVLAVTTQPGRAQNRSRPLALHRNEVLDTTGVPGVASFVGG